MADTLQSALVIGLRDTIKWESAVPVSSTGTLQPVDPAAQIDVLHYQRRDRELLYRDLIVGAAVVEVSVEVDNVWNASTERPILQGVTEHELPFDASEITSTGTNLSMVRHVRNTSIPWDAARFADADLYGRDGLVYETLARVCAQIFPQSPLAQIDSSGTVYAPAGTAAWSLAEGSANRNDINVAKQLNRDFFKLPDQNAADRDNQMAGYAARLAKALMNPFEFANRLYVRVDGPNSRETEVYTLVSADNDERVWSCEPALSNRNRIVYYVQSRTLQWIRSEIDEVHVPQLYALSIPGIDAGQTVVTVPSVPSAQDCQYWRGKAGQVVPNGNTVIDHAEYIQHTSSDSVDGGQPQQEGASLLTPDTLTFTFTDVLTPGRYRTNFLLEPDPSVDIVGAQNASNTSGTLGGATFEIDVPSGSITPVSYLVEDGDGIVYSGTTILPGETFVGIEGTSTYAQFGVSPSTVRQESIVFNLSLPVGPWTFRLEYTDLFGVSDGFGVQASYAAAGQPPVDIVQDAVPLPFSGTAGQLYTTRPLSFDVVDTEVFSLPIRWTYGEGQFHVRRLLIENTFVSSGSYGMAGGLNGTLANANFIGDSNLPLVVSFDHDVGTTLTDPVFSLTWLGPADMPVRVLQADIQTVGTFEATAAASEFIGWRAECLDRAERSIQQAYQRSIRESGSLIPSFITTTSGSYWNETSTEDWMSYIELYQPRLREVLSVSEVAAGFQYEVESGVVTYGTDTYSAGEKFYATTYSGTVFSGGTINQVGAFKKSRPGHVGQAALMPNGVYTANGTVSSSLSTAEAYPKLVSCQPWMIKAGVYVASEDFWMPSQL